jgi:adenylate kinase family enzyme
MGSPHHFDLVKNARRRISILGPSAGGKGEFAAAFMRCCDKPYIHLESGNFFRAALGANPDLRRRVNSGEVIATLDPISDQVTDGYSQAIRVLIDGGYVLEDKY